MILEFLRMLKLKIFGLSCSMRVYCRQGSGNDDKSKTEIKADSCLGRELLDSALISTFRNGF